MPTLKEILEGSEEVKTASAQPATETQTTSDEEIMKIATELGIYNELFPEDAALTGGETKTAEEEKLAAYQEALGARSYDYFAMRFDQRMDKIANEIMLASDMEKAPAIMQPSARAPQSIPTNQDPIGDKVPLTPAPAGATPYSLAGGAEHGAEGQVGHEEQQKMAAAMRKHFLLNALNK